MRLAALAGVLGLAAVSCGGAEQHRAPAQAPAAPISAADVTTHLSALQRIADRNHGTRAAGTRGERQTVDYLAKTLTAAGWKVSFTTVSFPFFEVLRRPQVAGLRRGRDFRVLEYSGSAAVTGRVTALDDRACTPAALEPVRKGDIVVVARGTCTFRRKALNAQRAGAAALAVADSGAKRPVGATLGSPGVRIPVLAVTGPAAQRLARADGRVRVAVRTDSGRKRTRDVIAETPPAPDGRVVMAGAHLDSVPAGPGINDDGSGVSALLEVAKRLSGRPGFRLGFWTAEELGLYGSRAYVRGLSAAERRAIVAYVNLDMVGSPKPHPEVYDTDDRVEQVMRRAFLGPEQEIRLGAASDHAPFQRAGIPVNGLFTGANRASDPCYHRSCDRLANVNKPMAAKMARAAQAALTELRAG